MKIEMGTPGKRLYMTQKLADWCVKVSVYKIQVFGEQSGNPISACMCHDGSMGQAAAAVDDRLRRLPAMKYLR